MELSHLLFEACQAHDMRIICKNTHLPGPCHTMCTHTLRYPLAYLRTQGHVTHTLDHALSCKRNRAHTHKYAHSLILPLIHTRTHILTHPSPTRTHTYTHPPPHKHTLILLLLMHTPTRLSGPVPALRVRSLLPPTKGGTKETIKGTAEVSEKTKGELLYS